MAQPQVRWVFTDPQYIEYIKDIFGCQCHRTETTAQPARIGVTTCLAAASAAPSPLRQEKLSATRRGVKPTTNVPELAEARGSNRTPRVRLGSCAVPVSCAARPRGFEPRMGGAKREGLPSTST